jgi:hypothetical protein
MATPHFDWTEEVIQKICDELVAGRPLYKIAKEPWCPPESTIYLKLAKRDSVGERIWAARVAQQHHSIEETIRIVDEATPETWQVARLQAWARQWRASKLMPKVYGDKQTLEHTGEVGFAERLIKARERVKRAGSDESDDGAD